MGLIVKETGKSEITWASHSRLENSTEVRVAVLSHNNIFIATF
jgi:hypothetical protein